MYALISLILAASLFLGGGVTVAAAQNDLPDQPLYPLKLWLENARLVMTGNPQEQADLLMKLEQTRVHEMAALTEEGINPPDQVYDRLETHLRQTMRLAAGMNDADLERTLLQLRDRLQVQDRLIQQLQTQAGPETEPLLTRTRQMLQLHLKLANQGLADPQGFRAMMQNRMQYGPDETATPGPNQQGEPGFHHNNPTVQPPGTPGAGNGNGNCEGNDPLCGPNPNERQPGNNPGNNEPGGLHPENPHDGNGPDGGGDNGNGPGCGRCDGGGSGGGHK
jgi:hypothetical protein